MSAAIKRRIAGLQAEALDFAPGILRVQHQPPSPLPRLVLHSLLALFGILLLWAVFGHLDIVAVAQGKLVPQTFLKIVQPSDAGIVKELLVREGDEVKAGQVLVRMDTSISDADNSTLQNDLRGKSLQVRRIDAELNGMPLKRLPDDPPGLYAQVEAQYRSHRQAYQDALEAERAALAKARQELQSTLEIEAKLKQTVPIYRQQEQAFDQLAKEGFAGRLMALERSRDRIEKEQDLRAQAYTVASLKATITQSEKRIAQITSGYRSQLLNERVEAEAQYHKLRQEWEKQSHRHALLELKAPQDGIIKDLATHTPGSVVSPGTVIMTLVPRNEALQAEVWVSNLDAGFVLAGQHAKVKLAAYPFQKYGMIEGEVRQVSPDATETPDARKPANDTQPASPPSGYRTLVALKTPFLEKDGERHKLTSGMQASAEINLGSRTILEYLLSPVQKTVHEAGRER